MRRMRTIGGSSDLQGLRALARKGPAGITRTDDKDVSRLSLTWTGRRSLVPRRRDESREPTVIVRFFLRGARGDGSSVQHPHQAHLQIALKDGEEALQLRWREAQSLTEA